MLDKIEIIAREAGAIVREGFGKNFQVEFKGNETNLVTEIDKASEKAIVEYIRKEFPSHSILAEEGGDHKGDADFLWVIDPIDGTTNFAHGLPIFSVSIGVQKKGETAFGIVYDIMMDRMYMAEKGAGAFVNGEKLSVSKQNKLGQSLLVTGFPYDLRDNPGNIANIFNDFLMNSRAVRRLGSAAIDCCYVAAGVFEGFWEHNLHPWDVCAGMLLIEEAGGKVTNFDNNRFDIFGKRFLATNGLVHDDMLELIKRNG